MTRSFSSGTNSPSTQSSAPGGGFEIVKKTTGDGWMTIEVKGKDALEAFKNEAGGHRWQRVPPTEKRDRVQTSTVTVSVMDKSSRPKFKLNPEDVDEEFMRGSGKGGQKRNKTSSACRLTHRPTGIQVRIENERSQPQNRAAAWTELERRLREMHDRGMLSEESSTRQRQAGSGMRGDKRRTYRTQDDTVTDHITGKKSSLMRVAKGELELLW